MKRTSRALLLVANLAAFFLTGCSNDQTTQPSGYIGGMTGKVIPVDVLNNPIPAENAGIVVAIEGTSYRTSTDTSGNWSIDRVPAGIYNLVFAKPGFDTVISQLKFSGAGISYLQDQYLGKTPTDTVFLDSASEVVLFRGDTNDGRTRDSVTGTHIFTVDGHLSGNCPMVQILYSVDAGKNYVRWFQNILADRNGRFHEQVDLRDLIPSTATTLELKAEAVSYALAHGRNPSNVIFLHLP